MSVRITATPTGNIITDLTQAELDEKQRRMEANAGGWQRAGMLRDALLHATGKEIVDAIANDESLDEIKARRQKLKTLLDDFDNVADIVYPERPKKAK